jgi:hypothetical protein
MTDSSYGTPVAACDADGGDDDGPFLPSGQCHPRRHALVRRGLVSRMAPWVVVLVHLPFDPSAASGRMAGTVGR